MKTKGILAILLVTTSGAVFSPEVVQGTIVEFHDDWIIHEGDEYAEVHVYDDATVGMTGGRVVDLYANDSSTVNLFDGEVLWLYAEDSSRICMYGGSIDRALSLTGSSVASLYGGMSGAEVDIFDSGVVKVYGYGFEFQSTGPPGTTGWLSGYWLDGTPFNKMYLRNLPEPFPGSHVVLIPEPGTVLLVALGGVGIICKAGIGAARVSS